MKEIKTGIYQIRNTVNGKRYIGSAINIYNRWATHKKFLNKGRHHNTPLQRAWDKYGKDAFVFELIEDCEKSRLINREQYYFDVRKPEYNISPTAGSCLGIKFTDEHRQKLRLAKLGCVLSEEHKENISKGLNASDSFRTFNKKPKSAKTKKKISETLKGRKLPLETRIKMSAGQMGRKAWNKGKKISLETRLKIKMSWIRRKNNVS